MNGLETAAGAIFVELIRQQAERPPSPADSNWSSLTLGQATGRQQHHPQAMKVRPHHVPPRLYTMTRAMVAPRRPQACGEESLAAGWHSDSMCAPFTRQSLCTKYLRYVPHLHVVSYTCTPVVGPNP